nr:hypothetical protein [Angustibacter aerolatus]
MSTLLAGLVDDAAVFPPGDAPLPVAVERHRALRAGPHADAVGPLLVPATAVDALPPLLTDGDGVRVGLVCRPGDADALAALARAVDALAGRVVVVEGPVGALDALLTARVQVAAEAPWDDDVALDRVQSARAAGHDVLAKPAHRRPHRSGAPGRAHPGPLRGGLRRARPPVQGSPPVCTTRCGTRRPRASSSTGCSTCWQPRPLRHRGSRPSNAHWPRAPRDRCSRTWRAPTPSTCEPRSGRSGAATSPNRSPSLEALL